MAKSRGRGLREVVDLVPPLHDESDRGTDAVVSALPTATETAAVIWAGDEEWVSTLPDPHDTTVTETAVTAPAAEGCDSDGEGPSVESPA